MSEPVTWDQYRLTNRDQIEYILFMEPGFNAILLLLYDDSFCWVNQQGSIRGGYSIQSVSEWF